MSERQLDDWLLKFRYVEYEQPIFSWSGGICVAGAAYCYGGGMGSACLVWNDKQVGVTFTAGGGGGYGYGLSVGVESSNASCIADLGKGFAEVGGGAGYLSGSLATSPSSSRRHLS